MYPPHFPPPIGHPRVPIARGAYNSLELGSYPPHQPIHHPSSQSDYFLQMNQNLILNLGPSRFFPTGLGNHPLEQNNYPPHQPNHYPSSQSNFIPQMHQNPISNFAPSRSFINAVGRGALPFELGNHPPYQPNHYPISQPNYLLQRNVNPCLTRFPYRNAPNETELGHCSSSSYNVGASSSSFSSAASYNPSSSNHFDSYFTPLNSQAPNSSSSSCCIGASSSSSSAASYHPSSSNQFDSYLTPPNSQQSSSNPTPSLSNPRTFHTSESLESPFPHDDHDNYHAFRELESSHFSSAPPLNQAIGTSQRSSAPPKTSIDPASSRSPNSPFSSKIRFIESSLVSQRLKELENENQCIPESSLDPETSSILKAPSYVSSRPSNGPGTSCSFRTSKIRVFNSPHVSQILKSLEDKNQSDSESSSDPEASSSLKESFNGPSRSSNAPETSCSSRIQNDPCASNYSGPSEHHITSQSSHQNQPMPSRPFVPNPVPMFDYHPPAQQMVPNMSQYLRIPPIAVPIVLEHQNRREGIYRYNQLQFDTLLEYYEEYGKSGAPLNQQIYGMIARKLGGDVRWDQVRNWFKNERRRRKSPHVSQILKSLENENQSDPESSSGPKVSSSLKEPSNGPARASDAPGTSCSSRIQNDPCASNFSRPSGHHLTSQLPNQNQPMPSGSFVTNPGPVQPMDPNMRKSFQIPPIAVPIIQERQKRRKGHYQYTPLQLETLHKYYEKYGKSGAPLNQQIYDMIARKLGPDVGWGKVQTWFINERQRRKNGVR